MSTPTSGTSAFSMETADIVVEGFSRCGLPEDQVDIIRLKSARLSLNLLFSEWANKGPNQWAVDLQTVALTTNAPTYTLPGNTIAILDAYLQQTGQADRVVSPISRTEYASIPQKLQSGPPTSFFLNRQITPTVSIWPVPPDNTYTLAYWRMRQLQDVSASAQGVDIPYRWYEAICAGLAAKLAVKFAPDRIGMLMPMAQQAWLDAASEDRQRTPTRIRPNMTGYVVGR